MRAAAANALFRLTDFGKDQDAERLTRSAASDEEYLEHAYTAVDTNFALGFLMEAIGSDLALDHDLLRWSALLGAVEALEAGTTAIVDHHESPNAIDGSLDVIAEACAEVGVRVVCAYGVTDRHGAAGAVAGLAENERFLKAGGRGMVGVHAAFEYGSPLCEGHPRNSTFVMTALEPNGTLNDRTARWLVTFCSAYS